MRSSIWKYVTAFLVGSILTLGYLVSKKSYDFFAEKYDEMQSPYPLREEYAFFWMNGMLAGDDWYNVPFNYLRRKAYDSAIKQLPKNDIERYYWEKRLSRNFTSYDYKSLKEIFDNSYQNKSKNLHLNKFERGEIMYVTSRNIFQNHREKFLTNSDNFIKKSFSYLIKSDLNDFLDVEPNYLRSMPEDYILSTLEMMTERDICLHKYQVGSLLEKARNLRSKTRNFNNGIEHFGNKLLNCD